MLVRICYIMVTMVNESALTVLFSFGKMGKLPDQEMKGGI